MYFPSVQYTGSLYNLNTIYNSFRGIKRIICRYASHLKRSVFYFPFCSHSFSSDSLTANAKHSLYTRKKALVLSHCENLPKLYLYILCFSTLSNLCQRFGTIFVNSINCRNIAQNFYLKLQIKFLVVLFLTRFKTKEYITN